MNNQQNLNENNEQQNSTQIDKDKKNCLDCSTNVDKGINFKICCEPIRTEIKSINKAFNKETLRKEWWDSTEKQNGIDRETRIQKDYIRRQVIELVKKGRPLDDKDLNIFEVRLNHLIKLAMDTGKEFYKEAQAKKMIEEIDLLNEM